MQDCKNITHFVITRTGVHYPLTEEQHEKVKTKRVGEKFSIEGNTVFVNNITDILTKNKYYQAYPNRRPNTFTPAYRQMIYNPKKEKKEFLNSQEKAIRMMRTFVKMLYLARGNKDANNLFEEPLYTPLLNVLTKYFEENPEETHAPAKLYMKIIPYEESRKSVTTSKGWQTMGQAMSNRFAV